MFKHESRLDDTIDFSSIVDNEPIEIMTKLGHVITRGNVQSVNPFGVIIKESGGNIKFYSEKLYLFSRIGKNIKYDSNQLNGMSLDDRVKIKLASMDEAGDPTPDDTSARPMDKDYDIDDSEDDSDDKEKEKEKEKEKSNKKFVDTDTSIDVDDLPKDIKNAIVAVDDMDESKLNSVLRDISDASIKALKRSGISETEIFGLVQKINDAIFNLLTGNKLKKVK